MDGQGLSRLYRISRRRPSMPADRGSLLLMGIRRDGKGSLFGNLSALARRPGAACACRGVTAHQSQYSVRVPYHRDLIYRAPAYHSVAALPPELEREV
jgi:hypothetical protein